MRKYILLFLITLVLSAASIVAQQHQGCVVAGCTMSFTHGPAGGDVDLLVYRLDASGNTMWRKNYGGVLADEYLAMTMYEPDTIIPTADNGYLLMGTSESYTNGVGDFLVYKLDGNGKKQWRKNYGGAHMEYAMLAQQTPDGGYLLAGITDSYIHGTPGSDNDILVYKIDGAGNKQWRKNYGGVEYEFLTTLLQTSDGGLILGGTTQSYTHGTPGTDTDLLVYKLNGKGQKQWRKNYGGIHTDIQYGPGKLQQTSDGGLLLGGMTQSYVHGTPGTDVDFLIYKLGATGNKLWRKNCAQHNQS